MMKETINAALSQLRENARFMATIPEDLIQKVLKTLSAELIRQTPQILASNKKDLERMDPANPKFDRLLLNEQRIKDIAADILNVAGLPDPLHQVLEERVLPNGLLLRKISVPIGIIGIIFESRPNVTLDVFSLCFRSGNACVLKGSQDAHFSNVCLVDIIQSVLRSLNIPQLVYLAPSERESLSHILEADRHIDTVIPRGGQGLIQYVRQHSKIPVIETGAGIVHVYVDKSADLIKAQAILKNSKTRRVSVCNALDTAIIHRDLLSVLPKLVKGLDQDFHLEIYADAPSFGALKGHYNQDLLFEATPEHYGTEFLSMKMAIKTVDNLDAALDHIFQYSSKHTESIVAEDKNVVEKYLANVDAAVVFANASTAFTDGAQFGLGAEIGISTQKLHARGPMALKELTSYKWIAIGNGQTRA